MSLFILTRARVLLVALEVQVPPSSSLKSTSSTFILKRSSDVFSFYFYLVKTSGQAGGEGGSKGTGGKPGTGPGTGPGTAPGTSTTPGGRFDDPSVFIWGQASAENALTCLLHPKLAGSASGSTNINDQYIKSKQPLVIFRRTSQTECAIDQFFSSSAFFCGMRPVVTNGALVQVTISHLRYQCARFYKQVGPSIVYCHSSGLWTQVPVCKGELQL